MTFNLVAIGRITEIAKGHDGLAGIPGFIEDYAFFIHGLIDLYEATFETRYLEAAISLNREMIRLFWDESKGGFFLTAKDAEKLILRPKEIYDGAIPSGSSVALLDLIRISRLTMDRTLDQKIEALVQASIGQVAVHPSAYTQMLVAYDFLIGPAREIVIAGEATDDKAREFFHEIFGKFLPNKVVILHPRDARKAEAIEKLSPFIKNQVSKEGRVLAFVCKNFACAFPTSEVSQLRKLLEA